MILLHVLLLLCFFNFSLSTKNASNILTFTHQMSTSHLSFVFNVAEKYSSSKQIYDIRWPIADSVDLFSTRKNFTLLKFSKPVITNAALAKGLNFTEILEIVPKVMDGVFRPCMLQDSYPSELNENNASLALIDPFAAGCSIVVARNFNAKIVITSPLVESCTLQYFSGAPLPVSYAMSNIVSKAEMNFFHRILNVFSHLVFKIFLYQLSMAKWFNYYDASKDVYEPPKPTMTIVNYHKFVELPLPRTNAWIDVGNSLPEFDNKISEDIENFINHYDQVVLLSFSTYLNDGVVSAELYSNYLKVFKNFPKIGFIWRQKEKLDFLPDNVLLASWINQRAVISHPKVQVLITHCGMNSVVEGLNAGIPIICIPEGNDQFYNAEKLRHSSLAAVQFQQSFTSEELTKTLEEVSTKGSTIRKKSIKIKEMLEFEREQKISTDITWALKKFQKTDTLDYERFYIPKGSQFSWSSYFLLDWFFVIIVIVGVVVS